LERAIEKEPNHCGCLAMLSMIHADGSLLGYSEEEKSADMGVAYAQRALDVEPSDGLAHWALAWSYRIRKEIPAFRTAAELALTINPWDGNARASIGMFIAYGGEWEKGCALVKQGMQLNPRHPGWHWFPPRNGRLSAGVNLPGFFRTHMVLAMRARTTRESGGSRRSVARATYPQSRFRRPRQAGT
jgi:hypothetical protein